MTTLFRFRANGGFHKLLHRSYATSSASSVSLIRDLRRQTSAPISLVKEALLASENNVSEAITYIHRNTPKSKVHRSTPEGLIGVLRHLKRPLVAVTYLGCETDFVARTPQFASLLSKITSHVVENITQQQLPVPITKVGDAERVVEDSRLEEDFRNAKTALGENVKLVKAALVGVPMGRKGVVARYVHGTRGDGIGGRIGVAVVLESEFDTMELTLLGEKIAMHIAAMAPKQVHRAAREKGDLSVGDMEDKGEALMEQEMIGLEGEGEISVGDYLKKWETERDAKVEIPAFVRYAVGEE